MCEQHAMLANVTALLNVEVSKKLVQRLASCVLFNAFRSFLEVRLHIFERSHSFSQRARPFRRCTLHSQPRDEIGNDSGSRSYRDNKGERYPGRHAAIISEP